MSVKDLIAKWEEALAEAQLEVRHDEPNAEELEAAALSAIAARSGLRAGLRSSEDVGSFCSACLIC
jgi:hypothetical protein